MSWWKKLFCGATPQSVALSTSEEPAVTPVSPPKSSPVSAPGVDSYNQGATLFVKREFQKAEEQFLKAIAESKMQTFQKAAAGAAGLCRLRRGGSLTGDMFPADLRDDANGLLVAFLAINMAAIKKQNGEAVKARSEGLTWYVELKQADAKYELRVTNTFGSTTGQAFRMGPSGKLLYLPELELDPSKANLRLPTDSQILSFFRKNIKAESLEIGALPVNGLIDIVTSDSTTASSPNIQVSLMQQDAPENKQHVPSTDEESVNSQPHPVVSPIERIKIKDSLGKETSFEFCPIHAGTFKMESNEVKMDQDFYLGKYPVTQQQWEAVMGNNPSNFKGGSLPVETVSWDDAQIFIHKLNQLSGKKLYRLPTEAEWEYACRAGTTSEYYFGDDASQLGEYAWFGGNSGQTTHPVGQKKPNEWGLYDMAGNVWEWMDSNWSGSSDRAVRGGGWSADYWYCRSAQSAGASPEHLGSSNGFRLVLDQTLKDEDRCSQTFPVDSPTELLLQDTLKHGLAPESYKQQDKVIRIHGSQGKETSFEFCPIPAGTFNLGSNEIKIDRDFYLGKYPVTQNQWEVVMGNNPSRFKGGSLPVETVSFDDAQLFIQKLNQLSGKKLYRLPTEEEWEYACRAGTITEYYFGDDESQLGEYAWYEGNSGQTTHPVGQKKPNGWGLYDLAGNVCEWTDSWYDCSRSSRVYRGGSWYSRAECCRSANRDDTDPGRRRNYLGFRLVFVP